MSDQQLENLYTFMDDTLGDHESRFVLKSLDHDDQWRARWKRFHHCRAAMHEPCQVDASSLSARISAALADEPLPVTEPVRRSVGWIKPVAGMAVAASVVLGAFAWLQLSQPQYVQESVIADERPATTFDGGVQDGFSVPNVATPASSSAWDPKLQNYLMRHSQVSESSQARNLMPYVHVISSPPTAPLQAQAERVDGNLLPVQAGQAETNRQQP